MISSQISPSHNNEMFPIISLVHIISDYTLDIIEGGQRYAKVYT